MLSRIARAHLHFSFFRDVQFYLALLIAPFPLLILSCLLPGWNQGIQADLHSFLVMAAWQPLIEELLFRGIIQGQLKFRPVFRTSIGTISLANLLTTVLFVLTHLVNHSPAWAFAVAVPSLVFGYFRDRHHTILPCVLLHSAYNICYLAIGTMHHSIH